MSVYNKSNNQEEQKGFWYYLMGILIIIGYIWLIISGGGSRLHGCYEDKYGNEMCYEDPRT